MTGRSPHGERGLKYLRHGIRKGLVWSLSSWRAWIEISDRTGQVENRRVALLMESVD